MQDSNSLEPAINSELAQALSDQKFALDQSAIVAQTDYRGVINYVNDYFCKISGYSREELLGQDHRILNSRYHPKEFFINLWREISQGHIWRGEICNRKKNGELYWVYTTIVPLVKDGGKPYQYLSIRQDITDLKIAQQTILEQQEALAAASKMSAVGEMSAAVTHEINNPLAVILGRCEMLKRLVEKPNFEHQTLVRMVDTIEVTGRRIEKIVKSMRSLAHHDYGDEPLTVVSVAELLGDATELSVQRFRNHGIRLDMPALGDEPRVLVRPHQIVQILTNLLNNAHDAIFDATDKWVKVEVSESEAGEVLVRITDSGAGIPSEIADRMFDPFFSTKKAQYGTGLGLSISKRLAQKNSGDLFLDRDSSHTSFVLKLKKK